MLLLAILSNCEGGPVCEEGPWDPVDDGFNALPSDEADWIFDDTILHEIEITLSEGARATLDADPEAEVLGSFAIDGEAVAEVGVRLRGGVGKTTLEHKPKLGIDFNEIKDGQRFYGLEKLYLNALAGDPSGLREAAAWWAMAAAGVPASRFSFASVAIDGEDYGIYFTFEAHDDRFLKARWDDPDGNLYDGKYRMKGEVVADREVQGIIWRLDFNWKGRDIWFELDEGEDVGLVDVFALSDADEVARRSDDYYLAMADYVDWGATLRMFAAEQWVGQGDGYTSFRNNYRVYFDPADGRAEWIPYDLDNSFGAEPTGHNGTIAAGCWRDPRCAGAWAAAVQQVSERIDSEAMSAWFDAIDALTYDAMAADTRWQPHEDDAVDGEGAPAAGDEDEGLSMRDARDEIRSWIERRDEVMRDAWCPETW